MEDAIPTPINLLQPYKKAVKIQVLCTMWRARIPETTDKYIGLRCILLDEKVSSHYLMILRSVSLYTFPQLFVLSFPLRQRRSLTSRSNARVILSS
ncbi:hypothetical protein DVH24_001000 [Malus domestica]|uniref:Uncharacterized protein n=1 Tax=Malus domestica TaxID=3750 RepID=A0A498K010_MALDO|nr:hypothetical protein DVH24_001000 [Malus domestica]